MEEGTERDSGPERGSSGDALVEERRAKRDGLRRRGLDPYPLRFDRTDTAAQLHERYADLGPDTRTGAEVSVAGRVASIRGHGKLVFATLQDVSGGYPTADERGRARRRRHGRPRRPRSGGLGRRDGRGGDEPPG